MSIDQSISMNTEDLLIGVDGGATKITACAVDFTRRSVRHRFVLGSAMSSQTYERIEGFTPVPITVQLEQRLQNQIELEASERRQAEQYVKSAAEVIDAVAKKAGKQRLRIGIGMPGLKTPDGRGIAAMNNGPRIPDYLNQLESNLIHLGLTLAEPMARLGSDADYCGLGEEFADGGCLHGVRNAYYIGGGSGLAEALKIDGELVPFDRAKTWILKAWQMQTTRDATFEGDIAPKKLNEKYALRLGRFNEAVKPDDDAVRGDPKAMQVFEEAADALAELIFERMQTLLLGRQATEFHHDDYHKLDARHAYRGKSFERMVIGQILGRMFSDQRLVRFLAQPCLKRIEDFLWRTDCEPLKSAYLVNGRLKEGLITVSALREAPALGAAIDAILNAKTGF